MIGTRFRRPHVSLGIPSSPGGKATHRIAEPLTIPGRRTAIIGMNHPKYLAPEKALWPDPNSTGGYLYKMLAARTGCTVQDYLQTFQRYNLCAGLSWNEAEASITWQSIEAGLIENFDCLILLGRAVRRCAGIVSTEEIIITPNLICLPHPSGLNRWYNDPINRAAVEILLEEVYTRAIGG